MVPQFTVKKAARYLRAPCEDNCKGGWAFRGDGSRNVILDSQLSEDKRQIPPVPIVSIFNWGVSMRTLSPGTERFCRNLCLRISRVTVWPGLDCFRQTTIRKKKLQKPSSPSDAQLFPREIAEANDPCRRRLERWIPFPKSFAANKPPSRLTKRVPSRPRSRG